MGGMLREHSQFRWGRRATIPTKILHAYGVLEFAFAPDAIPATVPLAGGVFGPEGDGAPGMPARRMLPFIARMASELPCSPDGFESSDFLANFASATHATAGFLFGAFAVANCTGDGAGVGFTDATFTFFAAVATAATFAAASVCLATSATVCFVTGAGACFAASTGACFAASAGACFAASAGAFFATGAGVGVLAAMITGGGGGGGGGGGLYLCSLGRRSARIVTGVPTGSSSKTLITSSERMRMQPQLTGLPKLLSSGVPWM